MKVFLSWSGTQSRAIAEALREWLPLVINAIDPWISSEMEKGRKWSTEIAERLESTSFGIICLTPTNLGAPWILFEAGALSKLKDAYVSTFLYGLTPAEVEPPLGQFQHTEFEESDTLRLVKTLNGAVLASGERGLPEQGIETIFSALWPKLRDRLNSLVDIEAEPRNELRSDRAILEEILESLRSRERERRSFQDLLEDTSREAKSASLRPSTYARTIGTAHVSEASDDRINIAIVSLKASTSERLSRLHELIGGSLPSASSELAIGQDGPVIRMSFSPPMARGEAQTAVEQAALEAGVKVRYIKGKRIE